MWNQVWNSVDNHGERNTSVFIHVCKCIITGFLSALLIFHRLNHSKISLKIIANWYYRGKIIKTNQQCRKSLWYLKACRHSLASERLYWCNLSVSLLMIHTIEGADTEASNYSLKRRSVDWLRKFLNQILKHTLNYQMFVFMLCYVGRNALCYKRVHLIVSTPV